jgi:N-acetylglucosamine-6-phosphate deacetylase
MIATGVTLCLPTLITADPAALTARFRALDAAVANSRLGPLMVPGYHLEGPFLNPAEGYAGCHPPAAMTLPDAGLVDRIESSLRRPILLVTLAPELPGSDAFIRDCVHRGRVVAVGHSAADGPAVAEAAHAGATLSTHLGNGLAQHHHKFANPLFAQLSEDRLQATFIADGIHIPPGALQVLLRAKSLARSILVTDAVAAAASPPGTYPFAGMVVERSIDGTVRLPRSPYLAGSSLTMDAAVRNVVAWDLCTVDEAVAMASDHPLAAMAGAMRHHRIPMPAGRVTWGRDLRVADVRIDGRAYPVAG